MRLVELPLHAPAFVVAVHSVGEADAIARRLGELGFVPGEAVEVRAAGPLGREPLMVQVGFTRFALRRSEAARVEVQREEVQRDAGNRSAAASRGASA